MRIKKRFNIISQIKFSLILIFLITIDLSCEKEINEENETQYEIEVLTIPNMILYEDFETININLDTIFIDPSGSQLTYELSGTEQFELMLNDNIVSISLTSPLILTEYITIKAENNRNQENSIVFEIATIPSLEYRIKGVWKRSTFELSATQLTFFESKFELIAPSGLPDGKFVGDYTVNNETWEYTWDLGPDGTVTLLDTDINRMNFNGVPWVRK